MLTGRSTETHDPSNCGLTRPPPHATTNESVSRTADLTKALTRLAAQRHNVVRLCARAYLTAKSSGRVNVGVNVFAVNVVREPKTIHGSERDYDIAATLGAIRMLVESEV
jgi:hypothetical protein